MAKEHGKWLIGHIKAKAVWWAYKWLYNRLDSKQKTKALLMINSNKGKKR